MRFLSSHGRAERKPEAAARYFREKRRPDRRSVEGRGRGAGEGLPRVSPASRRRQQTTARNYQRRQADEDGQRERLPHQLLRMSRCGDQSQAGISPEDFWFRSQGLREVSRREVSSSLCPLWLTLIRRNNSPQRNFNQLSSTIPDSSVAYP